MSTLRRSERIKKRKAIAASIIAKNARSKHKELYCICRQPQDKRTMICCDGCEIWYHDNCAKLTVNKVHLLKLSKQKWFCINCKKKKKKSTKRKRTRIRQPTRLISPPAKRHKSCTVNNDESTLWTEQTSQTIRALFTESIGSLSNHNNPPFVLPFAPPTDSNNEDSDIEILNPQNTTAENHINNEINNEEHKESDAEILNPQNITQIILNPQENHINNEVNDEEHKESEFPDDEILNSQNITQIILNPHENHINNEMNDEEHKESDDEIEIQAGDKWIGSQSFFENKEQYEQDIKQKKKEEIHKYVEDSDDGEGECVVLNQSKKEKHDICPLTLKKIEDPIKNMLCSHVFERDAIRNYREYLIKNDKQINCPVPGCQKALWIY